MHLYIYVLAYTLSCSLELRHLRTECDKANSNFICLFWFLFFESRRHRRTRAHFGWQCLFFSCLLTVFALAVFFATQSKQKLIVITFRGIFLYFVRRFSLHTRPPKEKKLMKK